MTKKDFFRLTLKLFGLYLLIQLTYSLISMVYYSLFLSSDIFYVISSLTPIVVYGIIAWFLIFKTDRIIKLLRLTKNYDTSEIKLGSIDSTAFIKIGLVLISSYLLFTNISPFLKNTFLSFKSSIKKVNALDDILTTFDLIKVDYTEWITSGINIILGYFILTNIDRISKWFLKEREVQRENELDQL